MRKGVFTYVAESLEVESVTPVNVEIPNGEAFIEKEYVLYAKIHDPAVLEKAESFVIHEQWEIKIPKTFENASSGRIRVRRIDNNGIVNYVFTTKTKLKEGEKEVELIASEDAFKQFKVLASSGMHKKRYFYPIEGTELKWEIDVFFLEDMQMSPFVKIDLEVKENLTKLPELPTGFTDIIYNQRSKQTEEEKRRIQEFYTHIFLKKNQHVQLSTQETI